MVEYTAAYVQYRKDRKKWRGFVDYYELEPNPEHDEDPTKPEHVRGRRGKLTFTLPDAYGKKDAERRAQAKLAELVAKQEEEQRSKGSNAEARMAVPDYVEHVYLPARQAAREAAGRPLQSSTLLDYGKSLKHIREGLSDVTVGELDGKRVEQWHADLMAGKLGKTGQPLGYSVTHKALLLLQAAMKKAAADHVVGADPCAGIVGQEKPRGHINALDAEGYKKMGDALAALPQSEATVAGQIALYAGLRRGEVCALTWGDVRLQAWATPEQPVAHNALTVNAAVGVGVDGDYSKAPKTNQRREVLIPAQLAEVLERWHDERGKLAAALGIELTPETYVLGDVGKDTPRSPDRISKDWAALSRLLAIRGTEGRVPTFHDLRHTYATVAVAKTDDTKAISAQLGHSGIYVTMDMYVAPLDESKAAVAAALERVARGEA